MQTRSAVVLDKVDPVWARIRSEAEEVTRREPELTTFMYENILHHDSLEDAVACTHGDVILNLLGRKLKKGAYLVWR